MSKVTTELRFLVEMNYDIGLSNYPIFDESYRSVLNQKIIDHYMFREIGQETPGRFKHFLKTRMNEIMLRYNKLYLSELLTFNPMYDHDISETYKKTTKGLATGKNQGASAGLVKGKSDGTDSRKDTGLSVSSTTPQGLITRPDLNGDIYASSAARSVNDDAGLNHNDSESNSTSQDYTENSSNIDNTDDFIRHISGNSGAKNFAELLTAYRETLLDIDMKIINDLNDLFLGVYS